MQEWYQSRALYETVISFLKKGQFDMALKIIREIPDSSIKVASYSKMVTEMARMGADYQKVLREALEATMALDEEARGKALMSLAFELMNLGKFEDALMVGNLIPDVSGQSKVKAEVALKLAEKGDVPGALKLINDILDEDVKTWAMAMLSNKMRG